MLTETDIEKFQQICKEKFGTEIDPKHAAEQAQALFNVMSVIYKPMTQKEYDQIEEHRKKTKTALIERLSDD